MVPGLSGGLTNSGTMPIDFGGGGPSAARATNNIGGVRLGAINMGGMSTMEKIGLGAVVVLGLYLVVKK